MKKSELLERIEILERRMDSLSTAFTKGRQCGGNVLARLAAEAGHPSMTVTATREEDAPLAAAATQALKVAEGDMAEKLREFLGPMVPDYMRQITVPLPPKPAYEQDVAAESVEAAADVAWVLEAMGPTINQKVIDRGAINNYFKYFYTGGKLSERFLLDLQDVCESVPWVGNVGKAEGLDKEFMFIGVGQAREVRYNGCYIGHFKSVGNRAELVAFAPEVANDDDKALAAANRKLKGELAGIGPSEQRIMTSGEFKAK